MKVEYEQRLQELKNKSKNKTIKLVTTNDIDKLASQHKEELETVVKSIKELAELVNVKIEITDLTPLVEKLDTLSELPESFKTIKELSHKIHSTLSQDKEVGIKGFRELWEMLVRANNKSEKYYTELNTETIAKFTDLRDYLEQLNEELKQGQQPEDFRPVRIVIGGDGTKLNFLKQLPSGNARGGGGGNLFVNGLAVTSNNPIPVDITDASVVITQTAPSAVVAFITDIPTAATRVQLASNVVSGVVIEAASTNTGYIYVGGSNVSSTVYGAILEPGQSTGLAIDNTSKIWVDTATNGNDVAVLGS